MHSFRMCLSGNDKSVRVLRAGVAFALLSILLVLTALPARAQDISTLTITVADPTGAVIVGALVRVTRDGAEPRDLTTAQNGTADVTVPRSSRVNVQVEAEGFETAHLAGLDVRRDTRRTVKLAIAKVYETVDVGRDPRARASDPRSDAFATILGAAEIQELPDDPDEMERVLKDMAGPGAVMRVNGFRGGRLPPKDQIAQIRFHRNMFAADAHEPGFLSVDIVTKPGFENWRGSTSIGMRDAALNARNAFAPERGDESNARGALTMSGPLWKKHTSLSISLDGTNAHDSQTIVAASLAGAFAQTILRPTDSTNVTAHVEHALSSLQQLRVEVQRSSSTTDNLGIGNFDLESRGYRQTKNQQVVRGSVSGAIGKALYNDARISFLSRTTDSASHVQAPTVAVLNAFTTGGAQIDGARQADIVEVADDLDISRGRHAARAGVLLETGHYETTELTNPLGTFTFADLDAFARGQATAFTRTVGRPDTSIGHTQFASYVQDDIRISPMLTISGGVRQEYQSRIGGLHLGPRGGVAWSPFRSGRTTVRGGAGIFFDWFDADNALQVSQLDGTHQAIETYLTSSYPNLPSGTATHLSNGRIQMGPNLSQPMLREANLALEQTFGSIRLNAMTIHRRGSHELRGIDMNAPVNGVRPDPTAGPVTEMQSIARSGVDALSINLNFVKPERRTFVAANYTLARAFDETDSPFALPADAANLAAEHGPSLTDARHRVMGFASFPVAKRLSAGVSFNVRSGLPYNITTGRDDNGDSISTDRPTGVTRNSGRGRVLADVGGRLAWRIGLGSAPSAGPSGPQVRIVRGGDDASPLGGMPGADTGRKCSLEVYAQVFNALNHLNAQSYGTVVGSPFFGRPVSAGAPRRVEVGARLSF